jgi:transposase
MKAFLTPQDRESLRLKHRSMKDGRTRDRIKAVLLSDKGWTFKAIAEALLLDEETISQHVNDSINTQKLSLQVGGSQSKLDASQTQALVRHIEENTYLKISDICVHVQEAYGMSYTVSGMRSWLKHQKFSFKKPAGTPLKADLQKQEAFKDHDNTLMTTTPS